MEPALASAREELKGIAARLVRDMSGFPIRLDPICKALGVAIDWRTSIPAGKAYLRYAPTSQAPPVIILPAGTKRSSWTRFCAAHELGHYFLIKQFGIVPKSNRDYWKVEEVCDEFARLLLIPETFARETMVCEAPSAHSLWLLCNDYSRKAEVPWVQVGVRISHSFARAAFFRIEPTGSGAFEVKSSSLARAVGRGTRFAAESAEAALFRDLIERSGASSQRGASNVTADLAAGGKLANLLALVGASELLVEPKLAGVPHFRMVMA